jgi:uncharacterized phage protein (TIGR01671 family)
MELKGAGCSYSESFDEVAHAVQWQQFTGLLDRHGKEIYEGDIVQDHRKDTRFKVIFDITDDGSGFYGLDLTEMGYGINLRNSSVRVIGNIYENPELINKGE